MILRLIFAVPEVAAEEKKAGRQSPLLAKTWKQTPLTITILLTVMVFAVVVDMAGTTRVAEAVVGAAAGAAAGVGILQLLWEAEATTGAVAGSIAGTAAAILHSLVGAQSLTASAVAGAMAGVAIVAAAKTINNQHMAVQKEALLTTTAGESESTSAAGSGRTSHTESAASGEAIKLFGELFEEGADSATFGSQEQGQSQSITASKMVRVQILLQ